MKYEGSCHCGSVAFEVEGEVDGGLACNCSMCGRRGSLLWFVPGDGRDPQGRSMAAVNLRVMADLDLDAVPVQHYDGRAS